MENKEIMEILEEENSLFCPEIGNCIQNQRKNKEIDEKCINEYHSCAKYLIKKKLKYKISNAEFKKANNEIANNNLEKAKKIIKEKLNINEVKLFTLINKEM